MATPEERGAIEVEAKQIRTNLFDIKVPHPPLEATSVRCCFVDESGKRCRRVSTTYATFCHVHAKQVYGLEVKTSTIPLAGKGLFALVDFAEGDTIDIYSGKIYDSNHEVVGAYGFDVPGIYRLDAKTKQSCIARYINHSTASPNCRFVRFQIPDRPLPFVHSIVQTTRPLVAGEELLINYGPSYDAYIRQHFPTQEGGEDGTDA